jgi:hypothetical protein
MSGNDKLSITSLLRLRLSDEGAAGLLEDGHLAIGLGEEDSDGILAALCRKLHLVGVVGRRGDVEGLVDVQGASDSLDVEVLGEWKILLEASQLLVGDHEGGGLGLSLDVGLVFLARSALGIVQDLYRHACGGRGPIKSIGDPEEPRGHLEQQVKGADGRSVGWVHICHALVCVDNQLVRSRNQVPNDQLS